MTEQSSAKDANASRVEPELSVLKTVQNIKVDDFKQIGQMPCSRSSLLYGIGAGFGMGVLRFAYKGSVMSACNYAVGSFCGISLLAWEFCRWEQQRRQMSVSVVKRAPPSP